MKKAAATDSSTLRLPAIAGATQAQQMASYATGGLVSNAITAHTFAAGTFGALDLSECVTVMHDRTNAIKGGDLSHAEGLLMAQAMTLDTIFNELARRAYLNIGTHLDATERYLRLALKAQGQSRATLETLATIKNPPIVFAKQANIANGPQQVNNGTSGDTGRTPAHAEKKQPRQTKLLERSAHGIKRVDAIAATAAGGSDKELAPVGVVNRPTKPGR